MTHSKAPYRVGKDAESILTDYECTRAYQTGGGRIVAHSNGSRVYAERAGRKEQPVLNRLLAGTEFVAHVNFSKPCKLFNGIENIHKYQQIWYHGKYVRIHRLALILDGFVLTAGMHVDHCCERKNCWETTHLEEITPGENTRRYHNGRR